MTFDSMAFLKDGMTHGEARVGLFLVLVIFSLIAVRMNGE